HQELGIFFGVDVVRHHRDLIPVAQRAAQRERQRRLARADRSADADAQRHERNNLLYWVSCRADRNAKPGAKLNHCASCSAMASSRPPSSSRIFWPAVCPRGTAFTAAI